MAQTIGDSTLLDAWASSGDIVEPDLSKIEQGWLLGEQPPHEFFNWIQNTFGQKINHVLQRGVASWDSGKSYAVGDVVGSGGSVWIAQSDNTNSTPGPSNTDWVKVVTNDDVATTSKAGIVELADDTRILLTGGGSLTPSKQHHITDSLTYTLPDTSGLSVGDSVVISKSVSEEPTIDTFGTEEIVTDDGTITSIGLTADTERVFIWNGTNWEMVAGDQAAGFTELLSGNGWQKLPSGLIFQWGSASFSTTSFTSVTFPISFPNECLIVNGSDASSSPSDLAANAADGKFLSGNMTTTGFDGQAATVARWIALGY